MVKKAFITGNRGFVGQHLTRLLEKEGMEVYGYDLIDGLDVTDGPQLKRSLEEIRPDYIYHLAAVTAIPYSFADPPHCADVNLIGSANLLHAVVGLPKRPKILLASSTEVYLPAIDDTPLDETAPTQPKTPYGITKLAMEQYGAIYANFYELPVVVTRTNNHTGPGQDGPFAVTSFARQIVAIERGEQDVLRHGDLSSYKSYLDVRDVVRAYRMAIDLPPYIYNIASDDSVEVKELLDRLVAQAKVPIKTSMEKALTRPTNQSKTFYQTSSKLREAGWQPEYNLERTLRDVLDYWRSK